MYGSTINNTEYRFAVRHHIEPLESDNAPNNHVDHTTSIEWAIIADAGLIHAFDGAEIAMQKSANGTGDILLFHHSRWPWGVTVVQQFSRNRGATMIADANNP